MKKIHCILFFSFFLFSLNSWASQPPSYSQNRINNTPHFSSNWGSQSGVWLPLSKYMEWKSKQKKQPKGWVLKGDSVYEVHYNPKGFVCKGEIPLQSNRSEWNSVVFLKTKYPLMNFQLLERTTMQKVDSWLIPPKPFSTHLQLAFHGKGSYILRFQFVVPFVKLVEPKVLLEFAFASSQKITIFFPQKGYFPSLEKGWLVQKKVVGETLLLTTTLAGNKKGIELSWWQTEKQIQQKEVKKNHKKARVYAETYSMLSMGSNSHELFFTTRYKIAHAGVEKFEIFVPKGWSVRQVLGLGVKDYQYRTAKEGQILDVLLVEKVDERYELSLYLEKQTKETQHHLTLPIPSVQRLNGFLGVEVTNNDEIFVTPQHATTIDARELPKSILDDTSKPILYASRCSTQAKNCTWNIQIQRHPTLSMPVASVKHATYTQVVNEEGDSWVHAVLEVQNSFKQFIAFTMPKTGKVHSSFVSNKPAKPAKDKQGRILIPLKRASSASSSTFQVELIYSLEGKKFRGISNHHFELPKVDVETSKVSWTVYLPNGTAEFDGKTKRRPPYRSTFYYSNKKSYAPSPPMQRREYYAKDKYTDTLASTPADNSVQGILPIRIKIPKSGIPYFLEYHYLAKDQSYQINARHYVHWFRTIHIFLSFFGGFFLLLGLALFGRIFEKKTWFLLCMVLGIASLVSSVMVLGTFRYYSLIVGLLTAIGVVAVVQVLQFFEKKNKAA